MARPGRTLGLDQLSGSGMDAPKKLRDWSPVAGNLVIAAVPSDECRYCEQADLGVVSSIRRSRWLSVCGAVSIRPSVDGLTLGPRFYDLWCPAGRRPPEPGCGLEFHAIDREEACEISLAQSGQYAQSGVCEFHRRSTDRATGSTSLRAL